MKKLSIITLLILISFLLSTFLFSTKNQAGAQELPPGPVIPIASITLDGNPSDWSNIDTVYIDAGGDDYTDYTGADIKSFKFAQDSDFVYIMADFYDGVPNEDLGQAESFAYQFHFSSINPTGLPEPIHIDDLGVIYNGVEWDITYLSLVAPGVVSGSLIGSSVAVDSVIELKVPKDKLPGTSAFCLQMGTGMGIDGVLGDITEWRILSFEIKTLHEKAADLAKQLANHPEAYLWGGKGWDYNLAQFVPVANILSSYTYWNPTLFGLDTGIGVDCSGLITWAFNRAFDAFTPAIDNFVKYVNANGLHRNEQSSPITETDILPGDAMFFDWGSFDEETQTWDGIKDGYIDHTAMYVGESGEFDVVNAANKLDGIITNLKNNYKLVPGFVSFRRIHEGDVAMEIITGSPVDLTVTDPDGFTITLDTIIDSDEEYIREIPNTLYYLEMERGADGNPIDRVYSPLVKNGNYIIEVLPITGTSLAETYSLEFQAGGQIVVLAENVPISEIPSDGYGITVEESGAITTFIPVLIDIKPGSYPNSINLGSNGVVPVAIFGSATLDVHQIDPTTIKLANALSKLKGNGQSMANYSDVNEDGFIDIVIHIITDVLQLTSTDVDAELDGFLLDGRKIKGSDSIRVVSQ